MYIRPCCEAITANGKRCRVISNLTRLDLMTGAGSSERREAFALCKVHASAAKRRPFGIRLANGKLWRVDPLKHESRADGAAPLFATQGHARTVKKGTEVMTRELGIDAQGWRWSAELGCYVAELGVVQLRAYPNGWWWVWELEQSKADGQANSVRDAMLCAIARERRDTRGNSSCPPEIDEWLSWLEAQMAATVLGAAVGADREQIAAAAVAELNRLEWDNSPGRDEGCGDNSCDVARPQGMGTNGGCRCSRGALARALRRLRSSVAKEREACMEAVQEEKVRARKSGEYEAEEACVRIHRAIMARRES